MSEQAGGAGALEALADWFHRELPQDDHQDGYMATCEVWANHLLASDWLAEHDAKVRAAALRQAAGQIEDEWHVWYDHGHSPDSEVFNAFTAARDRVDGLSGRVDITSATAARANTIQRSRAWLTARADPGSPRDRAAGVGGDG